MTISDLVAGVRSVPDPLDRARRVGELLSVLTDATNDLGAVRREAAEELLAGGMTQAHLADALGMSRARIGQIIRSGPAPERVFLGAAGAGPVTVVVAGKLETDRADPQPVVAQDDLAAYETLAALARDLGLETRYEARPSGGWVPLNRERLVVLVGPRHAPNVREVLESDDALGFEQEAGRWQLVDRHTGETYRSPMDDGEPGDVAYLGRLPRPDGRGTFIYAAGIHAAGDAGAALWLARNLAELYRDVRVRRFSLLIGCRWRDVDGARQLETVEQLTPTYRPGVDL